MRISVKQGLSGTQIACRDVTFRVMLKSIRSLSGKMTGYNIYDFPFFTGDDKLITGVVRILVVAVLQTDGPNNFPSLGP